uniref:Bestrophin homolog n=1 Tax=Syphacia muris TaxID=451379 RepID=A0A0N5AIL2_9BILA
MTIHYNQDLSTATYGSLLRMATRWKGSLWKTVYQDLILWCIGYAILSVVYRTYANVVISMQNYEDFLPLTFMLGFYVTLVCTRWWSMIMCIGLIDNLALTVANYLRTLDQRAVQYKRAIVRYMCLLQVMVYRSVSTSCKKKYPTLESIAAAGYLNDDELKRFSEDNFWLSVHWALALTVKARDEGLIKSDYFVKHIVETCISFRTSQITLWIYSWIPIPLVYTQVRFFFFVTKILRRNL